MFDIGLLLNFAKVFKETKIKGGRKSPLLLFDQMDIKELIINRIEEIITDTDLYIVDVKTQIGRGTNKITVLLDSDQGVTIDECAEVSRKLGHRLEEENTLENSYILEVSSPGLDEPLKLRRQYVKNIGRELQITLEDNTVEKGKLEEVNGDAIVISKFDKKKKENTVKKILLKDIKKSNVLVSFK